MSKKQLEINREALLNIIKTSNLLLTLSNRFFSKFGITDVQFNILVILRNEDRAKEGLSQQELSTYLVVTKSNVVGLIDRMEKLGLVTRKSDLEDRRFNRILITSSGLKKVNDVEIEYLKETNKIMTNVSDQEKKSVISGLEKIRFYLSKHWRKSQ